MHADAAKLECGARQAAVRIERLVAGKGFGGCEPDNFLRSAVARQFEVIGEALGQLPEVDAATALRSTALPCIAALRPILIHGHAAVDNRSVRGAGETGSHVIAANCGMPRHL